MPGPDKVIKLIHRDGSVFDAATAMDFREIDKLLLNNSDEYIQLTCMDGAGNIVHVRTRPGCIQTYAVIPMATVQAANTPGSIIRPRIQ